MDSLYLNLLSKIKNTVPYNCLIKNIPLCFSNVIMSYTWKSWSQIEGNGFQILFYRVHQAGEMKLTVIKYLKIRLKYGREIVINSIIYILVIHSFTSKLHNPFLPCILSVRASLLHLNSHRFTKTRLQGLLHLIICATCI